MSSAPCTSSVALPTSCKADRRRLARRSRCSASASRHCWRLWPRTFFSCSLRCCWSPCSSTTRRRRASSSSAVGKASRRAASCWLRWARDSVLPRASSSCASWSRSVPCNCWTCQKLQPPAPSPATPTSRASNARPVAVPERLDASGATGEGVEVEVLASSWGVTASLTGPSFGQESSRRRSSGPPARPARSRPGNQSPVAHPVRAPSRRPAGWVRTAATGLSRANRLPPTDTDFANPVHC